MKKILKCSFLGLALAIGASTAAHADPWRTDPWRSYNPRYHYDPPRPQPRFPKQEPRTAPELDPSLSISGILLLGGSLTVLRARHRK
jgi:hypothetical protein